ncbi:hypothetical protein, partial [Mycoplasmopsis bovis]|uniref:hypothetical protein n=1 Tax=Mycoplasmopsis bovis TaxID=28903 RepID=UPI003D2AF3C8
PIISVLVGLLLSLLNDNFSSFFNKDISDALTEGATSNTKPSFTLLIKSWKTLCNAGSLSSNLSIIETIRSFWSWFSSLLRLKALAFYI